jgi:hypothetical protein
LQAIPAAPLQRLLSAGLLPLLWSHASFLVTRTSCDVVGAFTAMASCVAAPPA